MALKVQWTRESVQQLDAIILYLEARWSERELRSFFGKLDESIEHIRKNPDVHKRSERKQDTREYQLAPQTTIFYTFDDKVVTILLLWSNRMDPGRLKNE